MAARKPSPPIKSRGKMGHSPPVEAPIGAAPVPKRPAHRPEYVPTIQERSSVAAMVIAAIDQKMIAQCLRISPPTLRKHFRRELDTSYALVLAEIAGKLVSKARGGDIKAQIFYLETHGWVRAERVMVEDGDGADPTLLTDAEIEARIAKLSRRGKG